ncbi:MAG: hypothetical protein BWY32_03797 [bacterium ADurb.Bin243]|nr:MAG: hypothetical protein BWY32_03797 [bacterium ADurb.Bin243]
MSCALISKPLSIKYASASVFPAAAALWTMVSPFLDFAAISAFLDIKNSAMSFDLT